MSVTREHMALFLTRLAGLVGIEVASDPADGGFTDIGDLSAESQTAINQLADLGITQGTSATTYSPDDAVQRGHMALFIARLMDKMDPFADPDAEDDDDPFAYIPKQVVEVADDASTDETDETVNVGSPFTDLGSVTKEAYDAITALWELGVASGISATAYGPSSDITRAAMADFMADVLDHSNARPPGVTMQVTETTDFGEVEAVRAISVRDDSFAPMADVSVKVFTASDSGGIDDDTGKCLATTGDPCDWSDNEEITNEHGNNFDSIDVTTTDAAGTGTGNVEASETWYAWMGDEDNSEFVKGSSGEAMVTLTAKADALGIRVTTTVPEHSVLNQVKIGEDVTVVFTAQLIDTPTATADSNAVAKEGVTFDITRTRGAATDFPGPDDMKTDADGKVTFTIEAPTRTARDVFPSTDTVTFATDLNGDGTPEAASRVARWNITRRLTNLGVADVPAYAVIDDGMARIRVMVSYYDQYGQPVTAGITSTAVGETVTISVGDTSGEADTFATGAVRVRSNGTVRFTANIKATAGETKAVDVATLVIPIGTSNLNVRTENPPAVLAVRHANKGDDGQSGDRAAGTGNQVIVDADNDRFIIDSGDEDGATARAGVLYSYDSGDTFIVDEKKVDMDKFEEAIATNGNTVTVVLYSVDGTSIFTVE